MEAERERVDGGGDEVGSRLDRSQRRRDPQTGRALHVETHREPAHLADPRNELLGLVREQRTRGIVDDDTSRAELRELPRLVDERVGLVGATRAVDEARMERASGGGDRRARLAQVGDVVQRVVEPEHLDAVLRGAGDEAADDVPADRARSDQEAPAQRDSERCRDAGLDRPDPLPRALDPPAHGRVEDAAPRDLEAREARSVEDLGHPQDLRGGNPSSQRLLREQPDSGIDQLRHGPWTLATPLIEQNRRRQAREM